jgi:hypothetical protein
MPMPGRHALTSSQQLDEFDRRGVLRLPDLLCADRTRRARDHVLARLERLGLREEGKWCLDRWPKPRWPDTGLKASRIGNRHPEVEALIEDPALLAVIETLLEGSPPDRTLFKRPQLLLTLPNADTWSLPTGWHVDAPRLASNRRPGVQLFAFLDTVEPEGGGTLALGGSHRLFNEGRVIRAKELARLLCRHGLPRCPPQPGAAPGAADAHLEIIAMSGKPGDAYVIDLRVFHAAAPNATQHPRLMATHRFWRADVIPELESAFGWE